MNLLPNPIGNPLPEGSPNNQTKPNQTQTRPVAQAGGISRNRLQAVSGGRESTEETPLSEKWAKEIAWAEQHLPDEHPGFVCVAIGTMRKLGVPVSTKTVLAHLEASGRDRKSTDALAARLERQAA